VGGEEFFLTLYDRDVTICHYKVVTNLVFLNYIPDTLLRAPVQFDHGTSSTVP
jgi:hypothetical protein